MRWHNDRRLAREVPEIDLILGGHDHDYKSEMVSQSPNKVHLRAVPCTCSIQNTDLYIGIYFS